MGVQASAGSSMGAAAPVSPGSGGPCRAVPTRSPRDGGGPLSPELHLVFRPLCLTILPQSNDAICAREPPPRGLRPGNPKEKTHRNGTNEKATRSNAAQGFATTRYENDTTRAPVGMRKHRKRQAGSRRQDGGTGGRARARSPGTGRPARPPPPPTTLMPGPELAQGRQLARRRPATAGLLFSVAAGCLPYGVRDESA